MISVGIQENLEIVKAELNDKGTLVIGLKKSSGEGSMLDMLASNETGSTGEQEQDYFIWPFKIDEYTKTGTDIVKSAMNLKKALQHILEGYMAKDKVVWSPMAGMAINKDDIDGDMAIQSNITKLYTNIVGQFIEQIKPFLGKGHLFRAKLVRQSKDKQFSSFPPRVNDFTDLDRNPIWETMDIKAEASNVKYSNYELGYRKGDAEGKPSGVDLSNPNATVASTEATAEETAAVTEMFGGSEG